jgi:predicted PurR-regulated permease PerM
MTKTKEFLIFWLIPLIFVSFWYLKDVLLVFFVALVFGSAIQVWALWLKHKFKLPFLLGVFLIYLILVVSLVWTLSFLLPVLFDDIKKVEPSIQALLSQLNLDLNQQTLDFLKTTIQNLPSYNFGSLVARVVGGALTLILIFVLSFYVATQEQLSSQVIEHLPIMTKERYRNLWRRIRKKFSFWFLAQLFLMVVIGLASYLLFIFLKIPHAPLVGVLAGLTEIVPVLGPIIGGSVAVLVTLVTKPDSVFLVLAGFFVIQEVENKFLVPMVMKRAIAVSPIFTLLGILVGGKLGGVLGILAILPVFVVGTEIYQEIRAKKQGIEGEE